MATEAPKVYAAICKVVAALAAEGIAKGKTNTQQGNKYRGIDDVYNALCHHLASAQLCMLPRVVAREMVERVSNGNKPLFYVTLTVDYDLVSAEDGSKHTVTCVAEAMDSSDKATGKAMSYAYKQAAFQIFCIPVEGQPDSDAETPQPIPMAEQRKQLGPCFPANWKYVGEDNRAWAAKPMSIAPIDALRAFVVECMDKDVTKLTPGQVKSLGMAVDNANAALAALGETV